MVKCIKRPSSPALLDLDRSDQGSHLVWPEETDMAFDFTGKKILVTGSGRGIGRALVKALVGAGAEVYALSVTKENLDSLAEEVPGVHTIQVDLSDWAATRAAVDRLGPLNGLVNNAAILMPWVESLVAGQDDIEKVLKVNLMAAINVTQSVGKKMVAAGNGGSIVNVSSVCGYQPIRQVMAYNVAKAGLDMVSKQFSLELGPHNIRVNSVNPTVVMTDLIRENAEKDKEGLASMLALTPLGRPAELQEVADLVMFLLSDKSTMISGEAIRLDGGLLSHIAI